MRIKYLGIFLAVLLSICTLSCTDNNECVDWTEEKEIEISSELVPINIFGTPNEVDGMKVKIDGENHVYPINFIEGFEFEQGYLYTLKVEITHLADPPQDGYSVRIRFLSLVSKTKVEK